MKILAISGRVPAAEKKGDQVVSFFRIMHLACANEVELICFGDTAKPEDCEAKQVLEAAGIVVHFVRWTPWVAIFQLLQAIPNDRMPFQCALFRSGDFQRVLETVCSRFTPDALYCVMIRIVPNAGKYEGRIFVDMVDSMGLNFSRRADLAQGPKRWLLNLEQGRVANFERSVANRADQSFVVSKIDQQAIGAGKVEAIPLGIDMQRFQKMARPNSGAIIAFTGNMSYQPNVDAVRWFVQYCWPEVKLAVPGVQLVIAGSTPLPSIVAIGNQDKAVVVTGRVPSVAAILNTAKVAIAPMQSGSGMQFKILEAMACGIPVVTTTIGLGDIGCKPNLDLMVCDAPGDFTRQVVAVLKSEDLQEKIGTAGLNYVQANHSWNAINERFSRLCGLS